MHKWWISVWIFFFFKHEGENGRCAKDHESSSGWLNRMKTDRRETRATCRGTLADFNNGGLRDRLVLQPLSWALGMDEWSAEENRAPRHALCLRFHFNITVVLRLIDEGRRYSLLHRAVHSELFCLFFFSTSRFVVANSWPTWHDVHHSLVLSVSAVYSLTLTTYAVAAWGVYFVPLHTALWFKKKKKRRGEMMHYAPEYNLMQQLHVCPCRREPSPDWLAVTWFTRLGLEVSMDGTFQRMMHRKIIEESFVLVQKCLNANVANAEKSEKWQPYSVRCEGVYWTLKIQDRTCHIYIHLLIYLWCTTFLHE